MSDAYIWFKGLSAPELDSYESLVAAMQITAIALIPMMYILFLYRYGRKTILDYAIMTICFLDTLYIPYNFSRFSLARANAPMPTCSAASESVYHAVLLGGAAVVTSTVIMRLQLFMHPQTDTFGAARRRFSDRHATTTSIASSIQANAYRRKTGLFCLILNVSKSILIGAVLPAVYEMVYIDGVGGGVQRADVTIDANYTVIGDYGRDWLLHRRGHTGDRVLYQGGVVLSGFSSADADESAAQLSTGTTCKLPDAPANLMLAMWMFEVVTQVMVVLWFATNYAMRWVHRNSNGAEVVLSSAASKRGSGDSAAPVSSESGSKAPKHPLLLSALSLRSDFYQRSQSTLSSGAQGTSLGSVAFTADEVNAPPVPILPFSMGIVSSPISTTQSPTAIANQSATLDTTTTPKDSPNQPLHRSSQRNSVIQHTPKRRGSETIHNPNNPAPSHNIPVTSNTRTSILSRPQPQRGSIIKMSGALAASSVVSGKGLSMGPPLSTLMHEKFHKSSASLLEYSSEEIRALSRVNPAAAFSSTGPIVRFSGTTPATSQSVSNQGGIPIPVPSISTPARNSSIVSCQSSAISKNIVIAAAVAHRRSSLDPNEDVGLTLHSQPQMGTPDASTMPLPHPELHLRSAVHAIERKNTANSSFGGRFDSHERLSRNPTATITPSAAGVATAAIAASHPHFDITYSDMESLALFILLALLNIGTWLPWILERVFDATQGVHGAESESGSGVSLAIASILMAPLREIVLFIWLASRHHGLRVLMRRGEPWKDRADTGALRKGRGSVGAKKGTETGSGTDLKTIKIH
ncbi:hypothetical protein HDU77_006799 [Chytriomyces hyalinus]|nr:hypothetical protein HDU77_006799 [Chytriomyces hyalinus]